MPIAANPSRRKKGMDEDAFIAAPARERASAPTTKAKQPRRNVTLAFDAAIYERVGVAAGRLGVSRNAFFSTAAVEKMEQMGS